MKLRRKAHAASAAQTCAGTPFAGELVDRACQVLGIATAHERLIAEVIERVRRFMAVPAATRDPIVEEEFAELRRRLEAFLPGQRERDAKLLQFHLSQRDLEELVERGQHGEELPETRALQALHRELQSERLRLRERMAALPLYGPGS
jgi:hypothetical protein